MSKILKIGRPKIREAINLFALFMALLFMWASGILATTDAPVLAPVVFVIAGVGFISWFVERQIDYAKLNLLKSMIPENGDYTVVISKETKTIEKDSANG